VTAPATERGYGSIHNYYEGDFDHCTQCGSVTLRTDVRQGAFDARTGRQPLQYRYRCPRKRWWNFHTDHFAWPHVDMRDFLPVIADTPE
jgi:hypothetical protein